jgi:transposase
MTETITSDRPSVAKPVSRPRSRKPATVSASALGPLPAGLRAAFRQTLTFLGALRSDQLTAPCFDGPINGECFRAFVEQQLVPVLKPGDIVILDNLGSHKSAALRRILRAAGARLWYLPPYSPDLNPIEQAFAKIKRWMRSAQKRTVEDTWRHLGSCSQPSNPTNATTTLKTQDTLPSKSENALKSTRKLIR